jgi:hypothetical protein
MEVPEEQKLVQTNQPSPPFVRSVHQKGVWERGTDEEACTFPLVEIEKTPALPPSCPKTNALFTPSRGLVRIS